MSHAAMTVDTKQHLSIGIFGKHVMHGICVAGNACALSDAAVSLLDLDRLVKILQRERRRMVESVVGLGDESAQMVVRQMAIVANGHVAMS